jgi:putative spermidine/putrescine transport system permease protein
MRGRVSISSAVWLLIAAVYFIVPLAATLIFSLKTGRNYSYSLSAWTQVVHDHEFWKTIKLSGILAAETIVISLTLLVPTAYWAHLKLPKVRTYIEFVTILPFVVPPIILVVGLLQFFNADLHAPYWYLGHPYTFLVSAYVILAFPYVYRSLDAGFRAIDIHTLTEAAQSLGASWHTTFLRVILPNVRQAALSGAFLTLAIVMGEFTIASLALFNTFPVYINEVTAEGPYEAASLSLLSFVITWLAMAGLLLVGRPPRSERRRFLFLRARPVH